MIDFPTFRDNALANIPLIKNMSRNEIEKYIKSEYKKSQAKEYEHQQVANFCSTLPNTVWDDPDFLDQLEVLAREDEILTRYENGLEQG